MYNKHPWHEFTYITCTPELQIKVKHKYKYKPIFFNILVQVKMDRRSNIPHYHFSDKYVDIEKCIKHGIYPLFLQWLL